MNVQKILSRMIRQQKSTVLELKKEFMDMGVVVTFRQCAGPAVARHEDTGEELARVDGRGFDASMFLLKSKLGSRKKNTPHG